MRKWEAVIAEFVMIQKKKPIVLKEIIWKVKNSKILDFFYPARCPACDGVLNFGMRGLCSSCKGSFVRIKEPYCLKCGKGMEKEGEEYCADCREKAHFYKQGRALYEYSSVKESIYRFKYRGRQEYGEFYAEEIEKYLGKIIGFWKPDIITAVPLHITRERKRGYNQAALIAEALGRRMGIPVNTRLVKRIKKTKPQKELTARQRQNNLKKAFKIRGNDVKLSTIIVIDDIYTTGSTIDAMSCVLQEAGIETVYFIAIAAGKE